MNFHTLLYRVLSRMIVGYIFFRLYIDRVRLYPIRSLSQLFFEDLGFPRKSVKVAAPGRGGLNFGQAEKRPEQKSRSRSSSRSSRSGRDKGEISFEIYIKKILKTINTKVGFEDMTIKTLDSLTREVFERLVAESISLLDHSKRQTTSREEIKKAVKLRYPGNIALYSIQLMKTALETYDRSMGIQRKDSWDTLEEKTREKEGRARQSRGV